MEQSILNSPNIIGLPALEDNYIWLLRHQQQTLVVDPGDAAPVLNWCQQHNRQLNGILVTHTHWDHINGIEALHQTFPSLPIYANRQAQLAYDFIPLDPGQTLTLEHLSLEVHALAGHTPDHIGFYWSAERALFCGDSLFTGGCGRLFDGGSAEQMTHTLAHIAQFPTDTRIYCAHEYTLANLRFAQRVEPDNTDISQRLQQEKRKRQAQQPTVPSTLAIELATNPFMRTHIPQVAAAIEQWWKLPSNQSVERFARLREWKNQLDKTGVLERDE